MSKPWQHLVTYPKTPLLRTGQWKLAEGIYVLWSEQTSSEGERGAEILIGDPSREENDRWNELLPESDDLFNARMCRDLSGFFAELTDQLEQS